MVKDPDPTFIRYLIHLRRRQEGLSRIKPICSFDLCDRPATTKGLCDTHYAQQKADKTLTLIRTFNRHQNRGTCPEEGCTWPFGKTNFCSHHQTMSQRWSYPRRYFLAYRFDMTPEQYEAKVKDQDGKCAVCKQPEKSPDPRSGKIKALAIDHDHRCCDRGCSDCMRDLLCSRCNVGLGVFDDDPELILAAAEYLIRHAGG